MKRFFGLVYAYRLFGDPMRHEQDGRPVAVVECGEDYLIPEWFVAQLRSDQMVCYCLHKMPDDYTPPGISCSVAPTATELFIDPTFAAAFNWERQPNGGRRL